MPKVVVVVYTPKPKVLKPVTEGEQLCPQAYHHIESCTCPVVEEREVSEVDLAYYEEHGVLPVTK